MATHEQDLERGSEKPSVNTDMAQPQINQQDPVRQFAYREATMSPSQMTRHSGHLTGMLHPENPVLGAFRHHLGIYNDSSLAGPMPDPVPNRKGLQSVGNMISTLTGNHSPPNPGLTNGNYRPAANVGIYRRVIANEQRYQREYRTFAILINGALGCQIIFAAALTALGAGNGPHTAVTAFGALNTVIAGLLTFLKGSGLPNRLKYYANEWSKVREYIEQRERDFATDTYRGALGWEELAEEIRIIEGMYENVRKDIEANTPDSYVSMSNAMKSLSTNTTSNHASNNNNSTHTGVARGLSKLSQKVDTVEHDVRQSGNNFGGRIMSGISTIEERVGKSFGDLEKQTTVQIREMSDDAHSRMRDMGKQAEYRMTSTSNVVGDGVRQTQSSAEARMRDAQNSAQTQFNNAQTSAMSTLSNAQHAAKSQFDNTRNLATSRLNDAQNAGQTYFTNVQDSAVGGFDDAQHSAQSQYNDLQNTAVSRFNDAQQRLGQTQHQAESKAEEMSSKIANAAEKAAEKVLEFTRKHHREDA